MTAKLRRIKMYLWCMRVHAWHPSWNPHAAESWSRATCATCRDHDDDMRRIPGVARPPDPYGAAVSAAVWVMLTFTLAAATIAIAVTVAS